MTANPREQNIVNRFLMVIGSNDCVNYYMKKIILILSLFIFACDEEPDCAGIPGGSAIEDDCGVCSGGTTGLIANESKDCAGVCNGESAEDCDGVCGGSALDDDCGICTGGTTGLIANFLKDCAGECNGSAVIDECGECNGNGIVEGACDCEGNVLDCANECGGSAVNDDCGVCNGDNSICSDCAGVANGESVEDCIGVCGGTASIDECGTCTGGTTNLVANYLKDDCGVCGGDNSTCSGCMDVNAENYDANATIDDGSCISSSITLYPDFTTIMERDSEGNDDGIDGDPDGVYAACYDDDLYISRPTSTIDTGILPIENVLRGVYPNPIKSTAAMDLELATEIDVRLIVINQSNQIVATILDELTGPGYYSISWDGGSSNNELLPNDYYRIIADFGDYECFENIKLEHSGYGCMDSSACNYSQFVTIDNGSCAYPEANFDCDGNCIVEVDCTGTCGGDSVVDECGVCNGDNSTCTGCDGVINSGYSLCTDQSACNAGECLSNGNEGCIYATENFNCEGDCIAQGDNLDENGLDCLGTCGGNAQYDDCGLCNGDGYELLCIGTDNCTNMDCTGTCIGEVGFGITLDCAGVCQGSASYGCDGQCCGGSTGDVCAVEDECNTCDTDSSNDCIQDCNGDWGGLAEIDNCGTCAGGNTGITPNQGTTPDGLYSCSDMTLLVENGVCQDLDGYGVDSDDCIASQCPRILWDDTDLKGFDFSYCSIPQFVIPDYVPNFAITTLYLNDQVISDFSSIVNMTTLEDVNLEYNQISSLPSNFCNLVENPSTVKLTGNILDCSEIPICNSGTVICD